MQVRLGLSLRIINCSTIFGKTNPILAAEDGNGNPRPQVSKNKTKIKTANETISNSFLESFIGGPCLRDKHCASWSSVCAGDRKCHNKIWFWPVVLGLPLVLVASLTCSFLCGFFKCCCWWLDMKKDYRTKSDILIKKDNDAFCNWIYQIQDLFKLETKGNSKVEYRVELFFPCKIILPNDDTK